MSLFRKLFQHQKCNIIGEAIFIFMNNKISLSPRLSGMLHIPALPGTPASSLGMTEILDRVMEETRVYSEAGVDGVIIENMHDTPYCHARLPRH